MFPLSSAKLGDFPVVDDSATVYVTSPTAPRLKTMLYERLCMERWVVRRTPVVPKVRI